MLKGLPYGAPEEVARMMLFLASDESSFCTGGVYKQNLENLRRNHYAPIRHGSPCVTYETKVMRRQGAKRCAPSKATFLIMRSRP